MGYKRMALALGAGYVLGAKAGEKRYEQIKGSWEKVRTSVERSPLARRLSEMGKEAANRSVAAVSNYRRDHSDDGDGDGSSRGRKGTSPPVAAARRFLATARERGRVA